MSSGAAYGNPQFVIVRPPNVQQRSLTRVHFEGFRSWELSNFCFSSSVSCQKPSSKRKFLAKASASASSFPPLSGAGAEYSEQLFGAKPNQKAQKIAGIDQEEIEDPTLLADPDSCFCEFNGIQIHHKLCDSELPALKTLEGGTSSFTERKFRHSAGSLVAIDTYFEAPERVAALILVASSFVPPFFTRNVRKDDQAGIGNYMKGNGSNSTTPMTLFLILRNILLKFTKYIADTIVSIIKGIGGIVNSLYKKALSAILRSSVGLILIRTIIDKFGIAAIRAAWYDSNQVSDNVLRGYTTALRIKGWDKALVEYTVALLTDTPYNLKSPPAERLKDISCPVLIITGDTDRLVPAWNSKRLSRAIPGSCLEIIENCGHLPQEEKAEEFVSIIDKFLQRVFGAAQEESVLHVVI